MPLQGGGGGDGGIELRAAAGNADWNGGGGAEVEVVLAPAGGGAGDGEPALLRQGCVDSRLASDLLARSLLAAAQVDARLAQHQPNLGQVRGILLLLASVSPLNLAPARSFFTMCEVHCKELIDVRKITPEECDAFEPFM